MTLFREHRGMLEDSMKTCIEIKDSKHLYKIFSYINCEIIQEPYCYDERIKWDTYIIYATGYGVLGLSNGPIPGIKIKDTSDV